MKSRSHLVRILATASVACLLAAPSAFAQDASIAGYGGEGGENGEVIGEQTGGGPADNRTAGSGPAPVGAETSGSALPFTGLDIGVMLAGSLVLIAAGAALARATRVENSS